VHELVLYLYYNSDACYEWCLACCKDCDCCLEAADTSPRICGASCSLRPPADASM